MAVHEVDFSFDVYPYLPSSTMLGYLLPYEAWEDGPLTALAKLNSPRLRARFEARLNAYDLGKLHIAWLPGQDNRKYLGKTLADYVEAARQPAAEALCDLLIEERLAVLAVLRIGEDRLVEPFVRHKKFMLGSDGIYFPDGAVHPRMYGSAARLLGDFVRRGILSLPEAVCKLSGYPAERFGLTRRGLIREGYHADLVLFDPASVNDPATFDSPCQLATGVDTVIVNGEPIIREGKPVEVLRPLPGRYLRFREG